MSLRFRHLEIVVLTEVGKFGTRISFDNRLVILRADNTSGKSTCIMSILYALGMEGMLGPSQSPPLPDAMRNRIIVAGEQIGVLESHVRLKIENHENQTMIVTRKVTGTSKERQLIETLEGPSDLDEASYARSSYFVRIAGAAQRQVGFHRRLAEFMGLTLPEVSRPDGEPGILYLECLFPFLFVDQLTGWRDIKSRMPTYLQIPEMSKRSTEYLLKLDIMNRSLRRQQLEQEAAAIKDQWKSMLMRVVAETGAARSTARGLPQQPVPQWPPTPSPELFVHDGETWKPFSEALDAQRKLFASLTSAAVPVARHTVEEDILALSILEESRDDIERKTQQAEFDVRVEQKQVDAIIERLRALREDLERHNDEKKLRDRGAVNLLHVAAGRCPACDQPIKDVLLPQSDPVNPMSLEENIGFIREQISIFDEVYKESRNTLDTKIQALSALRQRGREIDLLIRRQKETMRGDGAIPSAAIIQQRLQAEDRISNLTHLGDVFNSSLDRFAEMSKRWAANEAAQRLLDDLALTSTDENKLALLESDFVAQLEQYGFSSYPINEIKISRETYRPSFRGYDLGITSASDAIRMIWAYLLSMLDISTFGNTNHPGFLIFDEPRQQSAASISFNALLTRAAATSQGGKQIIFATSQEEAELIDTLRKINCQYLPLPSKILRPLD